MGDAQGVVVDSGERGEDEVRAVDLDEREEKAVTVGRSQSRRALAEEGDRAIAQAGDGDGDDASQQGKQAVRQLEKDLSLTEVSVAATSATTPAGNEGEEGAAQVRSSTLRVQTTRISPAAPPRGKAQRLDEDADSSSGDTIATTVTRTVEAASITQAPGAGLQPSKPTTTRVYIVRHGERLDEVPDNTWYREQCARTHGRTYDPPLTDQGKLQARGAAKFIATRTLEVDVLYTSSLVRCVSTAAIIASDLNLKVVVFDALAECAAAVRERSLAGTALASDQELAALVQEGDATLLRRHASVASRFRQALVELCEQHAGRTFLICAHREAIRDLLAEHGETARLGYCAVAGFEYQHANDTFKLVDAHKDTVRVKRQAARWW